MDILNATTVALIIAVVAVWIGVQGMVAGHRKQRQRGPDALMHYPVPLPWLRRKVNSAQWVVWLGVIYALGGAVLGAIALIASLPSDAGVGGDPDSCPAILSAEELASIARQPLPETQVMRQRHGCVIRYTSPSGTRLAEIRVHPPEVLIGAGYDHHRRELERRALVIEPLTQLGPDGLLAHGSGDASVAPVLLFRSKGRTVRIELDQTVFSRGHIQQLVEALAKERTQATGNQG